jgi:hypothetical protein
VAAMTRLGTSRSLVRHEPLRPALAMATTWMTAPSIIIPRNANKLRKPKQQLSGTATASNKSRFMAKCVCRWLRPRPNSSPPRLSDNAVQKFRNQRPCRMQGVEMSPATPRLIFARTDSSWASKTRHQAVRMALPSPNCADADQATSALGAPRSPSCRLSNSGWAGPSPRRPRPKATSTPTSTSMRPRSSSEREPMNTTSEAGRPSRSSTRARRTTARPRAPS